MEAFGYDASTNEFILYFGEYCEGGIEYAGEKNISTISINKLNEYIDEYHQLCEEFEGLSDLEQPKIINVSVGQE